MWLCVDFFSSNYQNINENDRGIILWLFVSPKPTKNSFIDNSIKFVYAHTCIILKQICFFKISFDILCYYLSRIRRSTYQKLEIEI